MGSFRCTVQTQALNSMCP